MAAILAASEHSGEAVTEEGLTDAEKKTLFQMTVEEVRQELLSVPHELNNLVHRPWSVRRLYRDTGLWL